MILFWLACAAEEKAASSVAPISVEAWVEDKQVDSEASVELHIILRYLPEYSPTFIPPKSEGLTLELVDSTEALWIGAQQQQEFHYSLSGKDGSYIVHPGQVSSQLLNEDLTANLIYVDIGVAPEAAQLAEAIAPPQRVDHVHPMKDVRIVITRLPWSAIMR